MLLDPDARPVIGHRGASGDFPENTLTAFDAALAQGADAFELDVRSTKDGVAVVHHDPTVDRTTDGNGVVADLTLSELQGLDAGGGAVVPTLAQVLERYSDTPMIVELKERAVAEAVSTVLEQQGAKDRVLLGAFDHGVLAPMRRRGFRLSASRRQTAAFWAGSRIGFRPGGSYEAFTVPEEHGSLRVVDRRFVDAARERGKPVHVWTVNTVDDAVRLRAMGVAGIITNFPGALRAGL